MINKQAHQTHRTFKSLCDEFNRSGFNNEKSETMLKIYHDAAIECLKLFKFLHQKEPCDATRAYKIGAGKILIRLSSLRSNNRTETQEEFNRWIGLYL